MCEFPLFVKRDCKGKSIARFCKCGRKSFLNSLLMMVSIVDYQ